MIHHPLSRSIHHPLSRSRALIIDAWRGGACLLMIVYHFCYDLNYFKIIAFDFYHNSMWLVLRGLIVTLFIGIAGISLQLATIQGVNRGQFLKRVILLTGSAMLISAASWVLFEKRFIFFGILHFMVIASLLGLLFTRFFWFNLISGTTILMTGLSVQHPFFNQPLLQWVGLMTYKPFTEDYVPLLPWFGIMLLGLFIGQYLYHNKPDYLYGPLQFLWMRRLAWVGQHSLLIYMIHQPVLISGLFVVQAVIRMKNDSLGVIFQPVINLSFIITTSQ